MPSNRRQFLERAALIGVTLATQVRASSAAQQRAAMPTPRVSAMMKTFGLRYPIFQAGMGTSANPALAIAVSAAGGLGAVGMTNATPEITRRRVSQVKGATDRPFAVNYLLAFETRTLGVALDAGAPIVQFAWGMPSRDMVSAIRQARAKMGIQIGSPEGAARAIDLGADYIICQGTEAGGHVQALTPLYDVLPRVLDVAKSVPVIAAGGIADGAAMRRALMAGASGVLIGSRFVATREANSAIEYKNALTRAKADDTVYTVCFQDGWRNAPHRVIRNRTLTRWEAEGCPPPGMRPGEGEIVATNANGTKRLRYLALSPAADDTGSTTEMAMFAGRGVDAIRDIPPAGELVARLWKECLSARS